jgi:RNA recognition motif-containing protein
MSFTVFLGNLPAWVTADDIKAWLGAEGLVADHIKVIRNPETQESKGFAFIDAPNQDEMQSIIKRFDRAPLEDRLLRANPAQPPRGKGPVGPGMGAQGAPAGAPGQMGERPAYERGPRPGDRRNAAARRPTGAGAPPAGGQPAATTNANTAANTKPNNNRSGSQSAFAEELAKAL